MGGSGNFSGMGKPFEFDKKDADWFNRVIKNDISRNKKWLKNSKTDMERRYYEGELRVKKMDYAKALNITESDLDDLLSGKRKIKIKPEPRPVQTKAPNTSGTRVNGYGERTSRYITTSTYERAQRRLENQVANFMKGYR